MKKAQPQRFQIFTQTKDGKGFTIKGSKYIYKFDSFGGWKDQYGNYYNADGSPEQQPQGALSPDQMSIGSDNQYDQYQHEFGPSKVIDFQEDDHLNHYHIKNLQNISNNLSTLSSYPPNTKLRVYFSEMNYVMNEKQIYTEFSKKVKGIMNVILQYIENNKKNGQGHFIVKDINSAQSIVKLEGEKIFERNIKFHIESIQDFLMDPLNQEENLLIDAPKQNQKWLKKGDSPKKQQPKVEQKVQVKKQEIPQQWCTYSFQLSYFPKKQAFIQWFKTLGLSQQSYKDLKGKTRTTDGYKYGQIKLTKSSLLKCNGKQYNEKKVEFKKIQI